MSSTQTNVNVKEAALSLCKDGYFLTKLVDKVSQYVQVKLDEEKLF